MWCVNDYLTNGMQHFSFANKKSSVKSILRGVSQGSILGPHFNTDADMSIEGWFSIVTSKFHTAVQSNKPSPNKSRNNPNTLKHQTRHLEPAYIQDKLFVPSHKLDIKVSDMIKERTMSWLDNFLSCTDVFSWLYNSEILRMCDQN